MTIILYSLDHLPNWKSLSSHIGPIPGPNDPRELSVLLINLQAKRRDKPKVEKGLHLAAHFEIQVILVPRSPDIPARACLRTTVLTGSGAVEIAPGLSEVVWQNSDSSYGLETCLQKGQASHALHLSTLEKLG